MKASKISNSTGPLVKSFKKIGVFFFGFVALATGGCTAKIEATGNVTENKSQVGGEGNALDTAPAAPAALTLKKSSSNSGEGVPDGKIQIIWETTSTGIRDYTVHIFKSAGCAGESLDQVGILEPFFEFAGETGSSYSFKVTAFGLTGIGATSECSASIEVVAPSPAPSPDTTNPEVVDGTISVTHTSASAVQFGWVAADDAVSATLDYRVCLAPAGSALATLEEVLTYCVGAGWSGEWVAGGLSRSVSGLAPESGYVVNVVARDLAGNRSAYTAASFTTGPDDVAPQPGATGTLTIAGATDLTVNLSWTTASDNFLPSSQLDYRVCLSKQDNIQTVAAMEANCAWQSRWSRNLSTLMVDGLMGAKNYWVNVIVRDRRQNLAAYTAKFFTTPASAVNEYYVDDSYLITTDNGAPGLTAGDIVTFADGEHGMRAGLVFGTNAFSTLATANVAAAGTGGRIIIGTGEFTISAQIAVNANIAFLGQGAPSTKIKIGYNTGTSGDPRGAILVGSGRAVVFSNLAFDGTGFNVYQVIRSSSDPFRVTNSTFNQVRHGAYIGTAIVQMGVSTSGSEIRNNTMSNIHRIGVLYYANGGSTDIRWNHYIGKGVGDFLDHGVVTVGAATANVVENRIENNLGVATLDGSRGSCIWEYNLNLFPQSNMTAIRNELVDCYHAFYVGFALDTNQAVSITQNIVTGATKGLVIEAASSVIATDNWWGHASGPVVATGNPGGLGADIEAYSGASTSTITFSPWATDSWIP